MSSPRFSIPAEYRDVLKYEPSKDIRSEDEILKQLHQHHPVTSEKNIWCFWHSGIAGMPPWIRRNVASWVRMNPDWTVRVLSNVKSTSEYSLNYISADLLPDVYVKGLMSDEIALLGPHSSDFLRTASLYQHGGAFVDVGIMLVRTIDSFCWNQLQDPASPYQVAVPWMFGTTTANHFTAARKGDPLIQRWNILFIHLWEGRTSSKGVTTHPLLVHHFTTKDASIERMDKYNFDVISQEHFALLADYVAQIFAWERLCRVQDDNGFNCIDYWVRNVLKWDAREHSWPAEDLLGGFPQACPAFFDALCTPLDADPTSDQYKKASALIWYILANGFFQKIYRGSKTLKRSLGDMFDSDTEGHDAKKGTFGELFRWGCENLVQSKELSYKHVEPTKVPITTGLLTVE